MSFERFIDKESQESNAPRPPIYDSRGEVISKIKKRAVSDLVIVGGGIHGACLARLAAFNGLKVVLLERDDYASGTSSRSSKMAHGGLRYLGMYDFRQVMEGIKSREELFEVAQHMVKPARFLIPIGKEQRFFKYQLGVGLHLYDWMVRNKERKHMWIPSERLAPEIFGEKSRDLAGCYSYTDGILNDARLVIENIIAARQEGALCLNHARVDSLQKGRDDIMTVGWTDVLSGEKYESRAGIVVNCAGPWVPHVGRIRTASVSDQVRYSQGVHLIFDKPWNHPALFLPLEQKNQYYFVWPHFAGTMVGTTEREVDALVNDPQPTEGEVEELLARLRRDLPHAGLDRSTLHYSFAGVRTLPLRGKGGSTLQLSRKHIWSFNNGVLNLLGGKLTTSSWTAYEGLKMVFKLAKLHREPVSLQDRILPGSAAYKISVEEFRRIADETKVPLQVRERAISRLGSRVRLIEESPQKMQVLGGTLLEGEVDVALDIEQAETLEDLVRRRLDLEYLAGHGLNIFPDLRRILSQKRPGLDFAREEERYRLRLANLRKVMGLAEQAQVEQRSA